MALELIFKQTITLFNRYESGEGNLVWIPTILNGVHLVVDRAKLISMYGENTTDNVMVHVMYSMDGENVMIGDKKYVPPKDFMRLSDKEGYITFQMGDNFDFFMEGAWEVNGMESTAEISDEAYRNGFYNYMNHTYDNVFAVTSCAKYSLIPHFEVTGR